MLGEVSGPSEALLFSCKVKMLERSMVTRIDVTYPYKRIDSETGRVLELFTEPPIFEVKFYYQRSKKGTPIFKIFAAREANPESE